MDFMLWFAEQLKNRFCPHCANPITRAFVKGYSVYTYPCGCELYRVTLEPYKVASLDEYRSAKNAYQQMKKNKMNFTMSFRLYCMFRTRYKCHLIAEKKKSLEKESSLLSY